VLVLAAVAEAVAGADANPNLRYPDLQTLPPSELTPDTTGFGGKKRHILRFTNTVVNAGAGPLELRGDPATGRLVQRLYDAAGGFIDRPLRDADFIFHRAHNHWHLTDFAQYELWRLKENKQTGRGDHYVEVRHGHNDRGQGVRKEHSKTSFCVRDTEHVWDLPGTPAEPAYETCEQDIQGLSVGWGDTYRAGIADQWIDVGKRPLPDGRYLLRSIADPRNLLAESANGPGSNGARICFTFDQDRARVTSCSGGQSHAVESARRHPHHS
jgi:hypothetical protein